MALMSNKYFVIIIAIQICIFFAVYQQSTPTGFRNLTQPQSYPNLINLSAHAQRSQNSTRVLKNYLLPIAEKGILKSGNESKPDPKLAVPIQHDENANYFRDSSKNASVRELLVNTTYCQIPAFNHLDDDAKRFLREADAKPNCSIKYHNWSHVDGNTLVLHEDKMAKAKLSLGKKLECCFKIVKREAKGKFRDWLVSVSKCTPITRPRMKIPSEFITVECYTKNRTLSTLPEYRGWHSIATPDNNERETVILEKIQFWKNKPNEERPPNILIIGLDSTSRINFRRQAPKMVTFLEKLEAVEMLGYNRVGENTLPNVGAFVTGYGKEDYNKLCLKNITDLPGCPFIWKRFDEANYLTAHIEDKPNIGAFQYNKFGFSRQQVDFCIRPMMLHATKQYQNDAWRKKYGDKPGQNFISQFSAPCIGQFENEEVLLAYLESVMQFGEQNLAPVFSFYFATESTHSDLNGLKGNVDGKYAKFFNDIQSKGRLDNTILIVMGDHGLRFGEIKKTLIGGFEENLPNFWIHLPKKIRQKFPRWQEALEINSKRLSTPFHLYWTLNHVLDTFTKTPSPVDAITVEGLTIPRKYGLHHFLQLLPEDSSCSDVGIPEAFCACNIRQAISMKEPILRRAADAAIRHINQKLSQNGGKSNCSNLELSKLTAGALVDHGRSKDIKQKFHKQIVVGFITKPGKFSLEVVVDYNGKIGQLLGISHLQRIDGINQTHANCANNPELELICFCKAVG